MFKNLDRRSFIQAMAAIGLLPLWNVKQLMAAPSSPPLRFLFIPIQHGWGLGAEENIGMFAGSSTSFTLPTNWLGFEPIKQQCLFLDGLRSSTFGHKVNAHDASYTDILSAATPLDMSRSGGDFPKSTAPSIDYKLAQFYGTKVLQFSAGYASWGRTFHPMTTDDSLAQLPYYTSAKTAYDSLKTQIEGSGTTPVVDLVPAHLFSLLDSKSQALLSKLSGDERQKMDRYLASTTALKTKLTSTPPPIAGTAKITKIPVTGQARPAEIDSFLDMVRVAFTNNSHQVAVLGFGEFDNGFARSPALQSASTDFHEGIAHYGGTNPYGNDAKTAMTNWTQWYIQKVVSFVQSLEQITDFDGSPLINNTVIVLTGEIANGMHDCRGKGHIVIGGGSRFSRGKWLNLPNISASSRAGFKVDTRDASGSIVVNDAYWGAPFSKYTHADLFVQLANAAGYGISTFGMDTMNAAYNSMAPLNLKS